MVQLELTERLVRTLQTIRPALPSELADEVDRVLLDTASDAPSSNRKPPSIRTVPHKVLSRVSKWARKAARPDAGLYTLDALLHQTTIHAPPLVPRERSPELLAILAKLQLAQDKADYAAMTSLDGPQPVSLLPMRDIHDPSLRDGGARSVADEWQEVRRELSAIANVIASMFAVGTAVWWVGGGRSYAARLLLSMSGAVAIAAIEGFLYYRYFTRESAEEPAKRKRAVLAFDHMPPLALATTKRD